MSNALPPSGESPGMSWECPSCAQTVHGNTKPHFPIRSGDMQIRHKCPLCGHRHFRVATTQDWENFHRSFDAAGTDETSSALSVANVPWVPRTYKHLMQKLRRQTEMRSLEKLHAQVERATLESFSAEAHQLLFQSIVDRGLSRLPIGAHMVPAQIIVDLLVDLHQLVNGTPAQSALEHLLETANTKLGLYMPSVELKHSLDRIRRDSVRQLV